MLNWSSKIFEMFILKPVLYIKQNKITEMLIALG